jgi:hypothetical protein
MKSLSFFVLALCLVKVVAFAEDITLIDGRSFHNATVLSQTGLKVTIKHDGGLVSVGKELLPIEIRTKYPVNEAAYQEEERRAEVARKRAREQEKADSERIAKLSKQREESAAISQIQADRAVATEDAQYAAVEREALARAKNYFSFEYKPANSSATSWDTSVIINEVRPVEGWAGRWFVRGRANIKFYQSQGRSFTTESRDFEAYYTKEGRKTNFEITLR